MDRGRVGTLAIGNKAIREGMIKHQQDVHLERISKIKNRKPGSSNTLDNTAPVVVKAALNNPRKAALKLEFNTVTERENKVLLQKISAILTAPPKITDEDYVRMRKIVQNLKGGKQIYEEAIQMKHHKAYLKHLKTMGPYYKPKEWELDYRRQLRQQKFMRQVTYERPKDFVDPLRMMGDWPDVDVDGEDSHTMKQRASSAPLGEGSRSSAHVHRVKEVKDVRAQNAGVGGDGTVSHNGRQSKTQSRPSSTTEPPGEINYDSDRFEDNDPAAAEEQEQLEELAHVVRQIRVSTAVIDGDLDANGVAPSGEISHWVEGSVNCWLVDKSILVISTSAKQGEYTPAFDAEAEIDVVGLAGVRGISEDNIDKILTDSSQLSSLAKFIAESVEVRIEDGTARVVLNLSESEETEGAQDHTIADPGGESFFITGDEDSLTRNGDGLAYHHPASEVVHAATLIDDEAGIMSSHVSGVTIPVRSVFGKKKDDLVLRPKKDLVLAIARIDLENDEEISVNVQICSNSDTKFRGKPAIVADTKLKMKTGLPSIMRADVELLSEYFRSISQNLAIETHSVSGASALILTTGEPSSRS